MNQQDYEAEIEKLKYERDEARLAHLSYMAREQLECGWCRQIMQAPPGFRSPMTLEKVQLTVKLHMLDCPKHPVREIERESDEKDRMIERLKRELTAALESLAVHHAAEIKARRTA